MGEVTSTNWPEGYLALIRKGTLPLQGLFLVLVPNKCVSMCGFRMETKTTKLYFIVSEERGRHMALCWLSRRRKSSLSGKKSLLLNSLKLSGLQIRQSQSLVPTLHMAHKIHLTSQVKVLSNIQMIQ